MIMNHFPDSPSSSSIIRSVTALLSLLRDCSGTNTRSTWSKTRITG